MKRTIATVLAGLGAAAMLGSCAMPAQSDVTKKRLALVVADEKAVVRTVVDNGDKGFGPGDQMVEEAPVLDSSGKIVGNSFTSVAIVSGSSDQDFNGLLDCTFKLADGNIVFHGWFASKDLAAGSKIPVVGGTGAYNGATGTVTAVAPNDKVSNITFDLLLPKTGK
jgi:hypothetical protein